MSGSLMPLGANYSLGNAVVLPSSSSGNSLIQFSRDFIFPNNTHESDAAILLGRLEEVDLDDLFTSDAEKPNNLISSFLSKASEICSKPFRGLEIWPFATNDAEGPVITSRVNHGDSYTIPMVTLKDGAIVPRSLIAKTTLLMRTLYEDCHLVALFELVRVCKNSRYSFPTVTLFGAEPSKKILKDYGLMDEEGRVSSYVKDIVVNSVFLDEGFRIRFVDPVNKWF